jgi:hypothetical protein
MSDTSFQIKPVTELTIMSDTYQCTHFCRLYTEKSFLNVCYPTYTRFLPAVTKKATLSLKTQKPNR